MKNKLNESEENCKLVLYELSGQIITSIIIIIISILGIGYLSFSTIEISVKFLIVLAILFSTILIVKNELFEITFFENYISYRSIFKRDTINYINISKVHIYTGNGGFILDIYYSLSNKSTSISIHTVDSFHFRKIRKLLEQRKVIVIDESGYC